MLTNNPINLVADGKEVEFDTLRDFYLTVFRLLYHEFPKRGATLLLFTKDKYFVNLFFCFFVNLFFCFFVFSFLSLPSFH